ncbi:hypothetical protein PHYBLDRAFT_63785 [Phycomyces blakesleeanus NRRL 1555(-)]|uniref:Uncharacterized protein n=1 Tax=Phycomyces blakesleeanus (strain ATCC 8743b / DSM 1359 / FGSC 10004 / NBRC 33097 / NRRL 1555) TaxID=763407 RepID=A0A163AHH7_PHYB8|nr:hypothetical protein PHYBLDRAFT_63785 [Phycomyces blakesleeanus NRRL 1555(-)]OAD73521.1 hypothetical protein PHYBLDRAFT_63785 [Phycomyces blakesleeanus NRRL 1555(-)]|eukprot:XP_018291561.1 hypothetical protein PHYBLDRAFT_63785 [Phycomyces blakesleeanus NRRL 1555(-)]
MINPALAVFHSDMAGALSNILQELTTYQPGLSLDQCFEFGEALFNRFLSHLTKSQGAAFVQEVLNELRMLIGYLKTFRARAASLLGLYSSIPLELGEDVVNRYL